jgi:hypothetical protein
MFSLWAESIDYQAVGPFKPNCRLELHARTLHLKLCVIGAYGLAVWDRIHGDTGGLREAT